MNTFIHRRIVVLFAAALATAMPAVVQGQTEEEQLKLAALEVLVTAPAEKSLPIVKKVLASDDSTLIKQRALFVLSQMDLDEAQNLLLQTAAGGETELATEAIRMIGISGDPETLRQLGELYRSGSPEIRDAVFKAYLISGDTEAVYNIAANAESEDEFARAVDTLGAMGGIEELRRLRDETDYPERLIKPISIAGDIETLRELALDDSNPQQQVQAIKAIGIVGGQEANDMLLEFYRSSDNNNVRQAALNGMLIAGHDEGVLSLYRESTDPQEKQQLLRMLTAMDSDAAWEAIGDVLTGEQP